MATRAAQIELFLSPLLDPTTQDVCGGYTAYFYAAGTSTPKNVWTEATKTNPYTSYTLDSDGMALLYGDGIYKIVVKNLDGTTVLDPDGIKIQATTYGVRTLIATGTATPDDDVLLCNGTFTVNLQDVALFEHPVTVINIGSGTITVDPYSTQTIGGSSTVALTTANSLVTCIPDTTAGTWRKDAFATDLDGAELIMDADGDSSLRASADDVLTAKCNGADQVHFKDGSFEPETDNDVDLGATAKAFKAVYQKNFTVSSAGIIPTADATSDIGSASYQIRHAYIDGNVVQNSVTSSVAYAAPSATTSQEFTGLVDGAFYEASFYLVLAGVDYGLTFTFNNDTGNNYDFQNFKSEQGSSTQGGSDNGAALIPAIGDSAYKIGRLLFHCIGNDASAQWQISQWTNDAPITNIGSGRYSGASTVASIKFNFGSNTTGKIVLRRLM